MPSGVYIRKPSKKRDDAVSKNFAKGRSPEVRAKAVQTTIARWTEEKRLQTSIKTKEIMHRPDVREKHLKSLQGNSVNFKGGNGQPLAEVVILVASILEPLGFKRECPITTKHQKTKHKVPSCYKVDFGHPAKKIAVELDGKLHNLTAEKLRDQKKTEVLNSLGWQIVRVRHRKEVQLSHLSAILAQLLEGIF